MTINVEFAENASADEATVSGELIHRVKTFIGVSTKVNVHQPGSIARSEGKAKRVVDNR